MTQLGRKFGGKKYVFNCLNTYCVVRWMTTEILHICNLIFISQWNRKWTNGNTMFLETESNEKLNTWQCLHSWNRRIRNFSSSLNRNEFHFAHSPERCSNTLLTTVYVIFANVIMLSLKHLHCPSALCHSVENGLVWLPPHSHHNIYICGAVYICPCMLYHGTGGTIFSPSVYMQTGWHK